MKAGALLGGASLRRAGWFLIAGTLFAFAATCATTTAVESPPSPSAPPDTAIHTARTDRPGKADAPGPGEQRELSAGDKEALELAQQLSSQSEQLLEGGRQEDALTRVREALDIRLEILGPEDPLTAESLNDLGVLRLGLGAPGDARPHLEQALAMRKRTLGDSHHQTATSHSNVASLLYTTGDLDGARIHMERALAIWEETLGEDHSRTMVGLGNLASLLQEQGEFKAARACFERLLAIHERILGPEALGYGNNPR
jgi:tetratricopeptide (TPR) repeat protein